MLEIQAIIITSTQAICPFVTTSTLLANILTFGKRRTFCIYFTKYQRKEHKQYIHMVIYEADGYGKEGRNSILEESIEMKSWIYE